MGKKKTKRKINKAINLAISDAEAAVDCLEAAHEITSFSDEQHARIDKIMHRLNGLHFRMVVASTLGRKLEMMRRIPDTENAFWIPTEIDISTAEPQAPPSQDPPASSQEPEPPSPQP